MLITATRWRSLTLFTIVIAALLGSLVVGPTPPAAAISGSEFNPGNIISDEKFHDSGAMTQSQIQSFLELRAPSCSRGYVCLKDYRQDTWTRPADAQCRQYTGAGQERASTILAKVASSCGVNPQVLLVLLQKEQTLITSTAPSESRYRYATGYACPDTAPCNAEFTGYYNQLYKAAWQYRYYENYPTSYRYRANAVANIQWHPNAACGSQSVYIENQATANLYIYTPYAPNAAALGNLYGTGDACSSYGNRNFWRIFSDWFGSPTGPRNPNGALDFAEGALGGIQVSGWAVDPFIAGSANVWINVDGKGGPIRADKARTWTGVAYPGYGINHGFEAVVPAKPGNHRVCAYQISGIQLGCKTVKVPNSTRAAGNVDEIRSTPAAVTVRGWSVNKASAAPTYVWVNVDGRGRAHKVDKKLGWTPGMFPNVGNLHGFDLNIPVSAGAHRICVYGVDSVLLSCSTVEVPKAETGKLETAQGVLGGIRVTGWSVDTRSSDPIWVWVDVAGRGAPTKASQPSKAAQTAFPSLGANHGFGTTISAPPGRHTVCARSAVQLADLGCSTVTVPNNEVGHVDSVIGVDGGIKISGWSLVQKSRASTFVWVDVDGTGSVMRADRPLPWTDAYFPGVGANHGFSGTISATPGRHRVCITGTSENVALGCTDVVVPTSVAGSVDSVIGVSGGIRIAGWAVDRDSTATQYVWVDVDGRGRAVAANRPLNWIDAYFPGVGSNHGFDTVVTAPRGSHRVCSTVTNDSVPLGCTTVTVP